MKSENSHYLRVCCVNGKSRPSIQQSVVSWHFLAWISWLYKEVKGLWFRFCWSGKFLIILFPLQINSISNDCLALQFEDLFEMKQTECIFKMYFAQEWAPVGMISYLLPLSVLQSYQKDFIYNKLPLFEKSDRKKVNFVLFYFIFQVSKR